MFAILRKAIAKQRQRKQQEQNERQQVIARYYFATRGVRGTWKGFN
jgi:hypothetical protein